MTISGSRSSRPQWRQTVATPLLVLCLVAFTSAVQGQTSEKELILRSLTTERQMLTAELEEYNRTIDLLKTKGVPPEESANPAVRRLAEEVVALRERLVAITEREVTLLQEQIVAARPEPEPAIEDLAETPAKELALETKALRTHIAEDALAQEAESVERLHHLLENYYTELQESARVLPTQEEIARREMAQRDAQTMDRIPFSVDKVRLSGIEGSTALANITHRLTDPTIPESRRDIAPICNIRTRLFDTLVGSESRSLRPVGKNHYIAVVSLQPGDTTLTILSSRWELSLPLHATVSEFLVTLYRPPGGDEELHVFAVEDLMAAQDPHIPAWLPKEIELNTPPG